MASGTRIQSKLNPGGSLGDRVIQVNTANQGFGCADAVFFFLLVNVCFALSSAASVDSVPQDNWAGTVRGGHKNGSITFSQGSSLMSQQKAKVHGSQRGKVVEEESSSAESDSSDQGKAVKIRMSWN